MKRFRLFLYIAIAAALLLGVSAYPGATHAEPNNPSHLYLLEDVKIYNTRSVKGKPAAALKAGQVVTVVETWKAGQSAPIELYKVKTWLGNKWVKAIDTPVLTGIYSKEDRTVTSVYDAVLYDRLGGKPTSESIPSGQLHARASFSLDPVNWSDTFEFYSSQGAWYQVDTPHGPKWLQNPDLLENVVETPVSYTIKLDGTEKAYPHPYSVYEPESVDPQIAQVVAEWTDGYASWTVRWYKVKFPQGERWITGIHPLKDYRELSGTITLPTKTRYSDAPPMDGVISYTDQWLNPGDYEAFEASGDWVHIHTEKGDVWVNPKRALVEIPVGIVPADEKIKLSKESRYFRFPNLAEEWRTKGFYAPKTVEAFEKYNAEDGNVFYHFRWNGHVEWVLLK